MQDSQIEEIKNKLNVVDVVGSYIKLTKTGINYRGPCPFHSEKKPSFFVSPNRQMWKCFGCGKVGDIYEFVKEIEGVEFGDALRILAARAGVELKRENPKLRTERQRLYEICELACCFFEKQLEGSVIGKEAKEYLKKRGINEESIKKWRLGYSPDTWQSLSDFLVGKSYARQEIVKAGLAIEKENNKSDSYDRFRGRIIFPILDLNSQAVGFGARVFKVANEKETAKYINTPQTFIYNKSNILYGLNFAKLPTKKENNCVITEGYTDAIMAHQAGFINTVAASGTALTLQHLDILKRYTENLILAFDMDIAGDSATKRGINLAETLGFNIKVIETYSKDSDPADIIFKNPSDWEKFINQARSIMDYYFDSAFSAFDKITPEGKKQIGRVILPAIKRIQNKIERSHWIQKLSQKIDIREEAIIEELKNIKIEIKKENAVSQNIPVAEPAGRKKLLEDKIISLIFKNPYSFNLIKAEDYCLFSEKNKSFLENLNKASSPIFASEESGAEEKLKTVFADILKTDEYKDFSSASFLLDESESENDGLEELQLCLFQLKKLELKNELGRLSGVIKNDSSQQDEYLKEFDKKAKELHYEKK